MPTVLKILRQFIISWERELRLKEIRRRRLYSNRLIETE